MKLKNLLRQPLISARRVTDIPGWMISTKERMSVGMAVVAVLGAAAAYCAARAEQTAAQLESKLKQGQTVELAIRHNILTQSVQYAQFHDIQNQHLMLAANMSEEAKTDSVNAASLELRAQEESAVARTLYPLLRFTGENHVPLDEPERERGIRIDKLVSQNLSGFGFETACVEKARADGSRPSIWEVLTQQIDRAQRLVVRQASAIVVFVLALVFFTFAQLSSKQRKMMLWHTWLGFLTAIAGLLYAGWDDLDSWGTFAKFGAGIFFVILLGRAVSASPEQWERFKESGWVGRWLGKQGEGTGTLSWVIGKFRQLAVWTRERLDLEEEKKEEVHLEGLERPMSTGLRMPIVPVDEPFGRGVVRLIAGTALVSAAMGLLFSQCTVRSNQAASEAFEFLAERVRTNQMVRAEAYDRLRMLAAAREYQAQYWAAQERIELAMENPLPDKLDRAMRRIRQLEAKRTSVDQLALQDLDGPYGPDHDTKFPDRLLVPSLWRAPERAFAKGVGENEISLAWRRRATGCLRSLTLFAIALYLFGQALGMGSTRAAFTLAFYATTLVVAGILSPLVGIVRNWPPNEQAVFASAWHYGNGRALYEAGDLKGAVDELQQALRDLPTFALANYYLASAKVSLLTPQKQGYISQISKDALEEIVNLREQANAALVEQELSPPLHFLANRGFDELILGYAQADARNMKLVQNSTAERIVEGTDAQWLQKVKEFVQRYRARKHIRNGIKKTLEAIGRLERDSQHADKTMDEDENNAWLEFNLGLAYVANQDLKAGDKAYQTAMRTLAKLDQMRDSTAAANLTAGAISDLSTLQKYCSRINPQKYCEQVEHYITKMKTELILTAWSGNKTSKAAITEVELGASPGALGWHVRMRDSDPKRDVLTVVWYACDADYSGGVRADACKSNISSKGPRDDHWNAWWVMPKFSGSSPINDMGESWGFRQVESLISQPDCFRMGEYQVEFYLNGVLADQFTRKVTIGPTDFEPENSRDLNMTVCHPSGWRTWSASNHSEPGWVRGYVSPDRYPFRGAFLFTYYYPKQEADIRETALQRAQQFLMTHGMVRGLQASMEKQQCGFPYDPHSAEQRFDIAGGRLLTRSWVQEDGTVYVGTVFRTDTSKRASGDSQHEHERENLEDCEVLTSVRNIY